MHWDTISKSLVRDDDIEETMEWSEDLTPLQIAKNSLGRQAEPDVFYVGAVPYRPARHQIVKSQTARPTGLSPSKAEFEVITVEGRDNGPVRAGPEGRLVAPNFGLLTKE